MPDWTVCVPLQFRGLTCPYGSILTVLLMMHDNGTDSLFFFSYFNLFRRNSDFHLYCKHLRKFSSLRLLFQAEKLAGRHRKRPENVVWEVLIFGFDETDHSEQKFLCNFCGKLAKRWGMMKNL